MYTGEHVDVSICPVCGDRLVGFSKGCSICAHGLERGILVKDEQTGDWVHPRCLAWFGIDDVAMYERQYIDT